MRSDEDRRSREVTGRKLDWNALSEDIKSKSEPYLEEFSQKPEVRERRWRLWLQLQDCDGLRIRRQIILTRHDWMVSFSMGDSGLLLSNWKPKFPSRCEGHCWT